MPLDLLIVSVARNGDGQSLIGFRDDAFIRLVAPTPNGIIYPEHHQLHLHAEPRPLDLIRVEAPWADSRPTQPENRILDATPWLLLERPASRSILRNLEGRTPGAGPLFGTPGRAIAACAATQTGSILYIEPEDVKAANVWDDSRERYRQRIRFRCGETHYDLPLTDLHYGARLRRCGEGEHSLEHLGCRAPHGLRLVITLGEPFHGWCYKSVAGILPRQTGTLWRDAPATPISTPLRNAADGPGELRFSHMAGA